MANKNNDELVIDQDDLCDKISAKLKLDSEIVSDVLDAEMDFLEEKGLVLEDKPFAEPGSIVEKTADVNRGELVAYIVEQTDVNKRDVERILDAERDYLERLG